MIAGQSALHCREEAVGCPGGGAPDHLTCSLCSDKLSVASPGSFPNCEYLAIHKPAGLVAGRLKKTVLSPEGYDVKNVCSPLSPALVIIPSITLINTQPGLRASRPPVGNWPSEMVFLKTFTPVALDTLPIGRLLGPFCQTGATGATGGLLDSAPCYKDSKGDGMFPCSPQGYIARQPGKKKKKATKISFLKKWKEGDREGKPGDLTQAHFQVLSHFLRL